MSLTKDDIRKLVLDSTGAINGRQGREKACQLVDDGACTTVDISEATGIHHSAVNGWIRRKKAGKPLYTSHAKPFKNKKDAGRQRPHKPKTVPPISHHSPGISQIKESSAPGSISIQSQQIGLKFDSTSGDDLDVIAEFVKTCCSAGADVKINIMAQIGGING